MGWRPPAWIALFLGAALSACAPGPESKAVDAKGAAVSEPADSISCVYQARNQDYWFGSDDRGVYRYDGKALVHFTTNDGLAGHQVRGIQEDKAGRIYFTTNAGITRFDGAAFETLRASTRSSPAAWTLRPDDLWFAGPADTGVVYRFDGLSLHRLEIPKTRAGEDHVAAHPRAQYPNARYSPYDVYTVFKDGKGNLWFGTALLGACRYDGKSFAWIPEEELRNGSFGTRSIVEDKEGRFWFCNSRWRYEVDLRNRSQPGFKRVDGIRDEKDPTREFIGGIVSATLDGTGALWMATYREGVWRYDGKSMTHYPVMDGDKGVALFSIHQDNQGAPWVGTQGSGVYKLVGKSFEKFRPPPMSHR
jgi:ligand-binding sensor domain-containing protein